MKVALVLDDSIDRPDGVQQYVLTLGAFLERAGHEVHYVCSDATRTDVTVHSLARNVGVTFNGNGLRIPLPTSRAMLREFLERERYDVIHVQIPHSPLFAARVVDEARRVQARTVRIVGTFHILPDGAVSEHGTRLLGRWLRRNLAKFDAFCAVSPPAREFAGRAFSIDPRVIPCPVDVTRFAREAAAATRAPGADGRLVVAFLGRLVERKGAVELIAALAALDPVVLARIEVRIGGKGPLMGSLTETVARHGLDDTVTFAGFVAEEDKAGFYADADIAVFPATGGESLRHRPGGGDGLRSRRGARRRESRLPVRHRRPAPGERGRPQRACIRRGAHAAHPVARAASLICTLNRRSGCSASTWRPSARRFWTCTGCSAPSSDARARGARR
ncbi:glycosyltransferase family 4 protein [Demequina litorisediminis]|uniref:D-inositol 3-phosphate glycosyltransferase n=1 Tax=Demequina litorisediminis TaxID=1849022 RepID=A0ABQ6IF63_9MICO|nr:glycosyltransferase family 4 protein [Demequina litorisediminis]GMA36066.1 hypothetical protein GCM10025876_22700 [Demequina litorisediminis]